MIEDGGKFEPKNYGKNKIVLLLDYSDTHPSTDSQLTTQYVRFKDYLVEMQYKLDQVYCA